MKNSLESVFTKYIKCSMIYGTKSKVFFLIITAIELIDLFLISLDQINKLFYWGKKYSYNDNKLSKIILFISPYNYYFEYFSDENYISTTFSRNTLMLLILIALYILLIIFYCILNHKEISITSKEFKILRKITINFYDFIFYRLLSIYYLDILSREIIRLSFISNARYSDEILLFIGIIILIMVFSWNTVYFLKTNIWSNFYYINSFLSNYCFDFFFSSKLDITLFFSKLIIALIKNYDFYNKNMINFFSVFLISLLLIIIYGYIIYFICIILFTHSSLYINNNFFNKVRIFFIMLFAELILLRIMLHEQEDYKSFLLLSVIIFIINIYIVIDIIPNFIKNKAIKCNYYPAVSWYIQVNDIDLNSFITKWMANHKNICKEIKCLICSKLITDNKIEINELESSPLLDDEKNEKSKKNYDINRNDINNNSKDIKENNTNINNKISHNEYNPYTFNLLLIKLSMIYQKKLQKNELIRLDLAYINSLFISKHKTEFIIFTKFCSFLHKYYKYKNIIASISLIFEIIRIRNQETIKDYELIEKNEKMREYLREYISEYESFLFYSSKTPENYISMSHKFLQLKTLVKTIQNHFKKNLECNYQLIIMRYAYETLLHLNVKNSIQNFDLINYADFLDFHYNNDKIFLLKYNIFKKSFLIIKCSKNLIKYQGKSLTAIFPDFYKIHGINNLIRQLKNNDQNSNESKSIIEFIIKDLSHDENLNFIDSFKIKYTISPTDDIDTILLQGNYINNYVNYIIFKKNSSGEFLYSFSVASYKFLCLTPYMVFLLSKTGNYIPFKKIFEQKQDYKENEFLFNFTSYYSYFKKLIKCDALQDMSNYSQIITKAKEIKFLAENKKKIHFLLTIKTEFYVDGNLLIVYNIKENKKRKDKNKPYKLGSMCQNVNLGGDEEIEDEEEDFDQLEYEGKGLTMGSSILSSNSYTKGSGIIGSSLMKNDEKMNENLKKNLELKNYSYSIILFRVFLVFLVLFFLIFEINILHNFENLFDLFLILKSFKTGIESTPLCIISNFQYYYDDGFGNKSSMNLYVNYSKYLQNTFHGLKKLPPINEIIIDEININFPPFIESFNTYYKQLYTFTISAVEKLQKIYVYTYNFQISSVTTVVKDQINFITLFREYNNFINLLLINNIYLDKPFSLLNIRETGDDNTFTIEFEYSEFKESVKDETRKNMIILFLAYPSINVGLSTSGSYIQNELRSSLKNVETLLIIFFTLLIVAHAVSYILVQLFLYVYINIMKINIIASNKLFNDIKFIELHAKRLEQIKIINNLYSENPTKISEKIYNLEEMYRLKTQKENKPKVSSMHNHEGIYGLNNTDISPKSINNINNINNNINNSLNSYKSPKLSNNKTSKTIDIKQFDNENSSNENKSLKSGIDDEVNSKNALPSIKKSFVVTKKLLRKVLKNYKILVNLLYSTYYIFVLIFIILIILARNRLNSLVNYTEINTQIDELIFDTFNSLIYYYLSNTTTEFYSYEIYQNRSVDVLSRGINNYYSSIQEKEKMEKNYPYLFPQLNTIINLNCSDDFIIDKEFNEAIENRNLSYKEYVNALCEAFPVVKSNNDLNLLYEIAYIIEQLYNIYRPAVYKIKYEKYICNQDLYYLYTLVLFFTKIIRSYFNYNIFPQQMIDIFKYFTRLIIAYLVATLIFEVIGLSTLVFAIINKVRNNNKLLLNFIESLKF